MSLVKLFVFVAIAATATCQMYGSPGSFGYRFPIYNDKRNTVSGYGQVQPSPLVLGGGADWKNVNGHGASLSASHMPRPGMTSLTAGGQVGLINKPQDQVYAFGSHTHNFDNKFKPLGHSNTGGLGYQHTSRDGRTSIGAQAGANFVPGMKPAPQVNIGLSHSF